LRLIGRRQVWYVPDMIVSLKSAVQSAIDFARTFLIESFGLPAEAAKMVRLEEVDTGKTPETEVWLITLSLPGPPDENFPGLAPQRRIYKTFAVAGNTGEVLSMKIRELAGAE